LRSEESGRPAQFHGACPERAQATEGCVWLASLSNYDRRRKFSLRETLSVFTLLKHFTLTRTLPLGYHCTDFDASFITS
jgi:hypothetical protein